MSLFYAVIFLLPVLLGSAQACPAGTVQWLSQYLLHFLPSEAADDLMLIDATLRWLG